MWQTGQHKYTEVYSIVFAHLKTLSVVISLSSDTIFLQWSKSVHQTTT